MVNLLDNVENSVWHAFDFFALDGDATAPKSKLKTLTSHFGRVLDLQDADKGLDDYRSTPTLTFDQYRYYLFKEVFSALPDDIEVPIQYKHEQSLDEVCWGLCKQHYLERDNPVFPEDCVFKLFRVFCMLGEMVENDAGKIEVVMAAGEVEHVAYRLIVSLGRSDHWDPEEFDSVARIIHAFKFGVFLTVLESKYMRDVDEGGMKEAVRDVHDFFLLDVIKKGHLGKKLDLLPAFREHFFVLQPHALTLYAGSSEKEQRGIITIDPQCRVDTIPDSNTKSPLKPPGGKHHSRFCLIANTKNYEFQASDHRTRLQWINAFRIAIEHAGETTRYQRIFLEKRKILREEEKEREEEEMLRADSLDQTRLELEQEKLARVNAEEQAATLKRQRDNGEEKMKELEIIREQLEKLLEEEKQAKKDEEIVRTLQARILREEWARRETLERLQEEQKIMLEEERRKREEFEKTQQEKEQQLREAQKRVEEMERERMKLDRQLDLAQEKSKKANLGQEVLEAKIKLQEQERDRDMELDKEAASRVTSLNLSASFYVKNRDRPAYTPMRSASMRETSYSRSIRRSKMRTSNNDSLSVSHAFNNSNQNVSSIDEVTNGNEY